MHRALALTLLTLTFATIAPVTLADGDGARSLRTWFVGHNDAAPWIDRSPCVHEPVIDHVGGACFHALPHERAVTARVLAGTTGHAVGAAFAFHDTERVLAHGHFCGATDAPLPVPEGAVMLTILAHGPLRASAHCPGSADGAPVATAAQGEILVTWWS